MVPPPSQRGIGSFFRKEDDLNDEEWEDYTDRLFDQSEELNKAILASRTAAREALEAPKPVKPAKPAASSLELAAKVAHSNALSAKRSKNYRLRKKGKKMMELPPPEPEPVRGLK